MLARQRLLLKASAVVVLGGIGMLSPTPAESQHNPACDFFYAYCPQDPETICSGQPGCGNTVIWCSETGEGGVLLHCHDEGGS